MDSNYSLRDLQLTEYEILKEFKRVCDANGLKYYLCGGTLLGAVRHKGFIPWDDDVDVTMPYSDYQKFLKIAPNELDDQYFLQNYITDPQDHCAFTKIRKNDTAMLFPNHRRWTAHQGIWIDIFPLMYVRNTLEYKIKRKIVSISNFCQVDTYLLDNEDEYHELLGICYKPFLLFLKLPLILRTKIHSILLRCVFLTNKGEYFAVVSTAMTKPLNRLILGGDRTLLPFEDDLFSVPSEFDSYLKERYGDYLKLPPEEQRNGGHGKLIIDFCSSYEKYIIRK